MPYDLCGPAGDFFFNDSFWTKVLALARMFGWEPTGTLSPVDEHGTLLYDNWEGSYELFVHQRVSAEWRSARKWNRASAPKWTTLD